MLPRRVAIDIGAVDPSAALEAAAHDTTHDPDLQVVVADPGVDGLDPGRGALEMSREGTVDAVMSASPMTALLTAVRFLLRRRTGVRDLLAGDDVAAWPSRGLGRGQEAA